MNQFADSDINVDIALNCLSAFNLGSEYVFKCDMAIDKLDTIERYYPCFVSG